MIIDSALNIRGITAGFNNTLGAHDSYKIEDLNLDVSLLQKMLECEGEQVESLTLQYKKTNHRCKATVIGRKGFDDREMILQLE
jgi:hypothetical protein